MTSDQISESTTPSIRPSFKLIRFEMTERYRRDTHSRNLYQKLVRYWKLAPNRTQLCSVQVSSTRNFQTQPTNQTARFWSRTSVQVSGTNFLHEFLPRVSLLLGLFHEMAYLLEEQ